MEITTTQCNCEWIPQAFQTAFARKVINHEPFYHSTVIGLDRNNFHEFGPVTRDESHSYYATVRIQVISGFKDGDTPWLDTFDLNTQFRYYMKPQEPLVVPASFFYKTKLTARIGVVYNLQVSGYKIFY